MKKETVVTQIIQPEDRELIEAQSGAVECINSADRLLGGAVEKYWQGGRHLTVVKKCTPHGEWRPWLKSVGISKSKAHRLIQLSGYELSQLGTFASVDAALKALPPAKPLKKFTEPANSQDPEPVDTGGELVATPQTPKESEAVEHGQDTTPEPADTDDGDETAARIVRHPLDVGHTLAIYCGNDEVDGTYLVEFTRFRIVSSREGLRRWQPVGIVKVAKSGTAITYCLQCDASHALEYRGKTYTPAEVLDGSCPGVQVPWKDTAGAI